MRARPATSCCAEPMPYSDVSFELLNYDEDLLSRSIAVKAFPGRVAAISALTSDIRLLEIDIEKPIEILGRPICRSDASRMGDHPRVFDGQPAQRQHQAELYHQEIS